VAHCFDAGDTVHANIAPSFTDSVSHRINSNVILVGVSTKFILGHHGVVLHSDVVVSKSIPKFADLGLDGLAVSANV
jgi:hypothetical protein